MSAPHFERRRHTHYACDPPVTVLADLFTPPSVPVDTSEAAAAAIREAAPSIRDAIYALLALTADGLTAGEIGEALTLNPSTVRPRLRELEGNAPWAKGQLPARIVKTSERRGGMRVYQTLQ